MASTPSTPGRRRAATSRSNRSRRSAIAHGRPPAPSDARAGWSAAMIIRLPLAPMSSGRRRRVVASAIASGCRTRIGGARACRLSIALASLGQSPRTWARTASPPSRRSWSRRSRPRRSREWSARASHPRIMPRQSTAECVTGTVRTTSTRIGGTFSTPSWPAPGRPCFTTAARHRGHNASCGGRIRDPTAISHSSRFPPPRSHEAVPPRARSGRIAARLNIGR